MLARQGPHLPQSLRPARLGPRRRARARRLGRHQGDPGEGPRLARQRGEGVGPARARRRGLSDGLEMVVHAQAGRTAGRTISWSMPTSPSPAPARTARSCGTTRICWSKAASIAGAPWARNAGYIYIRGEFVRERERLQAAIDQAYEARLIGKNNVHGWRFRPLSPSRRRRLYLRRGDCAARKPGRQEGPAAAEAAVPGQCRALRLPDHRQQRGDHRAGARHPAPRRGVVRRHRPARTTPAPSSIASPATSSGRAMSKRPWAFRCAN